MRYWTDAQVESAIELKRRRFARSNLFDFVEYTRPLPLRPGWHHRHLASVLDRVYEGSIRRLMVFMPPRHGKSEFVSRCFPAYCLGRNPDLGIMNTSYADKLATSFNRDVQRIIGANQYLRLFPGTRLNDRNIKTDARGEYKKTGDFFEVVGNRGYLMSAGVNAGIAGFGFDIGIVDDAVAGSEAADSPTIRDKIWDWYQGDFFTRRGKNARIIVVMTRWHRDDLAGRLLKHQWDGNDVEPWTVLCYRGIRRHPAVDPNPYDHRAEGEVLWPEFMSLEEMRGAKTDPRKYAALYDQDPTADGGTEWPADCFDESIWVREAPRGDACVVAVDPSKGKESKKGDYTAIVCARLSASTGRIFVSAKMDRWNPTRIVEELFLMCDVERPDFVAIEVNQFQELFLSIISKYAEENRNRVLSAMLRGGQGIVPIENRINKTLRIRRLSEHIVGKDFRFVRSHGTSLLVDQLRDFPFADHDDGPDALEMAMWVPQMLGGVEGVAA